MNKIKVLHLYYDLMNLSGDSGNITAIKNALEIQKVPYSIDKLTIKDDIDFKKYDLVYIGHGSFENQELVRTHLLKYKKDILSYIEEGKFLIATGNSYELFGSKIGDKKCLGFIKFDTTKVTEIITDEEIQNEERLVSEAVLKMKGFNYPVIGFYNHGYENNNVNNYLFEVIKGFGNTSRLKVEGVHKYHFYGTYLLGPLLIRNPYFLDKIMKDLFSEKSIPYKHISTLSHLAYKEYLRNFKININVDEI